MILKSLIKILIADNDPKNLNINTLMLNSSSPYFKIEPCPSSTDALNNLRKKDYHLILSEHQMPVLDGPHLIKEAKEINPDIFSLLFTDKEIANLDLLMSEFKIDTCIKKPYTFTRLLSEITIGIMHCMADKPFTKKIVLGLKDKIISSLTEGDIVKIIKCSIKKEEAPSYSWRYVPANIYKDWTNIMWENHKLRIIDEFERVWLQEKVKYSVEYKNGLEPVDKLRIQRFDGNGQLMGKPIIRYFKKDEYDFLKDLVTRHYLSTCQELKTTRISGYLLET